MFKIKRVYEKQESRDGKRILVDRLWPRGLSKDKAKIDYWMKEIAPSDALRKLFAHKPEHWPEFRERYFGELRNKEDLFKELRILSKNKTVTLLYAARDEKRNNAQVLYEFINRR